MAEQRPGARRAHKHSSPRSGSGPLLQVGVLVLGAVLAAAAWFFLVRAAIDFGVLAVGGQGTAWAFTVGASLGAMACLVLVLALVGRGLRVLGFLSDYKPRRAGARRKR